MEIMFVKRRKFRRLSSTSNGTKRLRFVTLISLLFLALGKDDFYKVLGVSKSSSPKEIRDSYKKLAIKYHPDKNQGDERAQEKFIQVQAAYETLSDDQKRRNYDLTGSADRDTAFYHHEDAWPHPRRTERYHYRTHSSTGRTFHFQYSSGQGFSQRTFYFNSDPEGQYHSRSYGNNFHQSAPQQQPFSWASWLMQLYSYSFPILLMIFVAILFLPAGGQGTDNANTQARSSQSTTSSRPTGEKEYVPQSSTKKTKGFQKFSRFPKTRGRRSVIFVSSSDALTGYESELKKLPLIFQQDRLDFWFYTYKHDTNMDSFLQTEFDIHEPVQHVVVLNWNASKGCSLSEALSLSEIQNWLEKLIGGQIPFREIDNTFLPKAESCQKAV